MNLDSSLSSQKRFVVRRLLPAVAVVAFVAMVAVGESQVRSSPKWPPPSRHEMGAWEIEPPPVLFWAAFFNLPATLPILWMASQSDMFGYAFDDHYLIVYVPWIVFVYCLWYLVAHRLERFIIGRPWESPTQRNLVLCAQAFITVEMLWFAIVMRPVGANVKAGFICFCAWILLVVLGWVDVLKAPGRVQRGGISNR